MNMANWLNDPAVKALLPHLDLLEEAFGWAESEDKPSAGKGDIAARGMRRQARRDLAARRDERSRLPQRVKPAA